ncbi:MAG TPA: DUF2652 domain-containing protein [Solirubrobacteraceae bacterium]|nr:DUF2652 domain-containing protein [Solirubrobacteraceae bacterium]
MAVEEGLLVVADISGYTRYLGGVELEHSHDILADLIGVVAESLGASLRVAKLEGDAVFCSGQDAALLERLHDTYAAFATRQRTIAQNTSCECEACRRIPDLDLKFVAHHGSFVEHEVAGRRELVGADVITVHRLLKNTVGERLSLHGYALLSDACVSALRLDPAGLREHVESYEGIGEVHGVVVDLAERWRRAAPVRLNDGQADVLMRADVAAPAERVWSALTDAGEQLRWRVGATRVEPDGEPGVGTRTHCVHGKNAITQEIVDWRPQRYYSYTERNPIGNCLWTIELEPTPGLSGTRVAWRIALRGGRAQRLLYLIAGFRMRRVIAANLASFKRFAESSPERAGTEADAE